MLANYKESKQTSCNICEIKPSQQLNRFYSKIQICESLKIRPVTHCSISEHC